ncbi:hypothetical protein [Natronobiforma cellulositropha]|uniref:hypothetical protein n=1 Tax=Natronobiforma cellulositropha TaxID=1679076 RepID=UPI0021D5728B|nr:hypothetical protein [Natronobiforma cellulositropha]
MRRRPALARIATLSGSGLAVVLAGCSGTLGSGDDSSASDGGGDHLEPADTADGDALERYELGDLDPDDPPFTITVENVGDDTRALSLTVTAADGGTELDETVDLEPGGELEVLVGDEAGYDLDVETAGSVAQTSVRRSDGGGETLVSVDDGGVSVRTR